MTAVATPLFKVSKRIGSNNSLLPVNVVPKSTAITHREPSDTARGIVSGFGRTGRGMVFWVNVLEGDRVTGLGRIAIAGFLGTASGDCGGEVWSVS